MDVKTLTLLMFWWWITLIPAKTTPWVPAWAQPELGPSPVEIRLGPFQSWEDCACAAAVLVENYACTNDMATGCYSDGAPSAPAGGPGDFLCAGVTLPTDWTKFNCSTAQRLPERAALR